MIPVTDLILVKLAMHELSVNCFTVNSMPIYGWNISHLCRILMRDSLLREWKRFEWNLTILVLPELRTPLSSTKGATMKTA